MGFSASRHPEEKSSFPTALNGLSHEESGRVLHELGKIGGIDDKHDLLEAAGIGRDATRMTEVMGEMVKNFPLLVNQTIGDGVSSIKESQVKHEGEVKESIEGVGSAVQKLADEIKASIAAQEAQLKKARRASALASSAVDLKSCLIGAAVASLIILPISWFIVVPSIVRMENGSDWALKQYYNSAEGRQAREEFKLRCKGAYPCKKESKKKK